MIKTILCLLAISLVSLETYAKAGAGKGAEKAASCFMVQSEGKLLKNEGECSSAFTPQSTFKIPLAVMGFDS
ncbi:MAG: hypothetical protein EOP05_23275, partial [Proteobacteria bacterium]